MDLENTVQELCFGLTASRATDRKRSAESLKDFLSRNALGALLTKNTLKKHGFTWNNLFRDINDYILKETENFETSKTYNNVTGPLCTSLLHLCISGANKGKAYINCDNIISASLNILKDNRLTRAIGDAYLSMLYKYVLPHEYYLGFITASNWEDLLEVTITMCRSNYSTMDDFTKLRVVWHILKSGRDYCQLVIPIRDSLSKIKTCFFKIVNDKKTQEVMIEIMIILVKTLAAESRLELCEFTENVLSSLLNFYDQSFDQKKKASFFELLELIIILHHPKGTLQKNEGSLAHDWQTWNKQLDSILEIVCLEVNFLQKLRKQIDIHIKQSIQFFSLSATVYYQIFNSPLTEESISENTPKRPRITVNKNKTFNDLITEFQQNSIPWLGVIHNFIERYGDTISTTDYLSLLYIVESSISNGVHGFDCDIFEALCCSIIKIMNDRSDSNKDEHFNLLWKTCVRHSTTAIATQKMLHTIMQLLLVSTNITYQNVQPLIKLYIEKGMPVNDHSVRTLNNIFQQFFSKCSQLDTRVTCLTWLMEGPTTSVDVTCLQELLWRLTANENVFVRKTHPRSSVCDNLYHTLFGSTEKCILFSEFELNLEICESLPSDKDVAADIENNREINNEICKHLEQKMFSNLSKIKENDIELLEYVKLVRLVLAYLDIMLRHDVSNPTEIVDIQIYSQLKESLKLMYVTLIHSLKNDNILNIHKNKVLKYVQELIMCEYDSLLCTEIRQRIDSDFFHGILEILNKDSATDDDYEQSEKDEQETTLAGVKRNCILLMAAYCRKQENYTQELLEAVLEPSLYNFSCYLDVECAFQCIELLNDSKVEDIPIDSIFNLMKFMCRDLYRDPKATFGLVKILFSMLDRIWCNDNTMKHNCFIMVKSYLDRCNKLYYPPHVAGLIYKCAAKIVALSLKHDLNPKYDVEAFKNALINRTKEDIHCIRLQCVYLLKLLIADLSNFDVDSYLSGLGDIFTINVSHNQSRRELIINDESTNRTSTVLHSFLAIAQTNSSLMRKIVTLALQTQKEKSLDVNLVKKVLNIITRTIANSTIDVYLNNNVLWILNFWFHKQYTLNDLPIFLFGVDNIDAFLTTHMKWVVAAEILWHNGGNIHSSNVIKDINSKYKISEEEIVEDCFCNIIVLCLPYIVANKYGLDIMKSRNLTQYPSLMASTHKLFQSTRNILDNDKWSNLFVENIAELLLLAVSHLSDNIDTEEVFGVKVAQHTETYYYPKTIFSAILKYFGELTDENILKYMCDNQPVAIFKTLFKLWENILMENVFAYKLLLLNSFLTFVLFIPLDHKSDAFICNFICNSLGQAIKKSKDKMEIKIFATSLKIVLNKYLPEKVNDLRTTISHLLVILVIKKEDGYEEDCSQLLNYLIIDVKEYLNESDDVVDYIHSMSQGIIENGKCSTSTEFLEKLKMHKLGLKCPSHETLVKMSKFLKYNRQYVNDLCIGLDAKGFSENCETSLIHQIINDLSNILKHATDTKTIIEAIACLSEIGNYDLKTLVTVPTNKTTRIVNIQPQEYFASTAMMSVSDIMFDENPTVTNKAAKTLNSLLKFQDGCSAFEHTDIQEVTKHILKPFEYTDTKKVAVFKINEGLFMSLSEKNSFWVPNENEKHEQWLTRVTTANLAILSSTDNYLNDLHSVCLLKPSVCERILPSLIGLVLFCSKKNHINVISSQINIFFNNVWDKTFAFKVENSGDSIVHNAVSNSLDRDHKMVIQYMLGIVNFVRLQSKFYSTRLSYSAETLNTLNLEYDKVAWAATVIDQNFVAIYYSELWAMYQNNKIPPSSPEATTVLDGGKDIQRILRKCYVSIGEMDAIDGCGTAHLTIEDERRKHLIYSGQYTDALLLHDIALSGGDNNNMELHCGILRSLQRSGMYHIALQHIKSLPESEELNDLNYECLSALGDWSNVVDIRHMQEKIEESNYNPNSIIKAFRYACLKDCLTLQVTPRLDNRLLLPLNRAKLAVSKLCQDLNMENCQNVYKVLAKIHLFCDIEDYFAVRTYELPIESLLSKWQVEKLPAFHDFKHLEDLICQRNLMLENAAKTHDRVVKDIMSLQLEYVELSLENKRVQMAQRLLATVKKLESSEQVMLLESQISWSKGHNDIALSLLREVVCNDQPSAISLRQYGLWMAESKCDSPRDIIDKYLKRSLDILNTTDDTKTRLKLYNDIAKFSDVEYKKVVSYMNSSIFQNKVECLNKMKDTVNSSQVVQNVLTDEDRIAVSTNRKFMHLEEAEITCTKTEKENFLNSAMRHYLLSLQQCEENILSVFRVISLWFDNPSLVLLEGEHKFQDLLDRIPSRKFITVLPQLAPRLSNENTAFAENLRKIIKRCALEHPHHTLPILFSLKNSDKDQYILNFSIGASNRTQYSRSKEPRVMAAENLVREVANESDRLSTIVSQMERMSEAMISFANYKVKSKEPKQIVPSAENITSLGRLDAIIIPTVSIPIRNDCNYNNLPTLASFDKNFELVGGINFPKKISCRSSDGSLKILLIKGKDDLRQDAVMQQVFNIVNTLLEKNAITSRNKLTIRTYKVVPMSRRSGVLEWCEGTIPIGTYLTGSNGAHVRYRPQDITGNVARQKFAKCHEEGRSNDIKLRVFLGILKEFKPVFHYFFTEHYLDPVTWYERRSLYTKSVAASSMVGYILGLGDRHVQNILIDKKSAEVIHIDFGYAFDQGKILRTPETVPFRLTQDIIAGFGCSGVEGIFRRCCEKTMQLLRDNQETLLTILEVLLCDPLYSLTSRQNVQSAAGNAAVYMAGSDRHHLAERALLAVNSKLSGTEGGIAGGVSVPGQVARLIHTATDPANLCRLFPGWQPYL
ncbi:serine-protein kinase ATM-like [Achroia grisella]|uniref:serine-protein kinase ATM-like n=1 Tax=Achroia grisella TaxID=688607 RepID=UPI0027D31815|nr:serine-protein kinase ATM-like [Achroia grisella]